MSARGYKVVNYGKLPLLMLQAVKDFKAENDGLKQKLQQDERLRRLQSKFSP